MTAVLLLAFNRPDTTRRVLSLIARAQPPRLYVATDGPRMHCPSDVEKCLDVRSLFDNIDWPCQLRALHQHRNLGCGLAVQTALDWFFECEDEGIILEDDCLPDLTFFRFCSELLVRFREDQRIFAISGDNFVQSETPAHPSYWFNRVFHCWGWATWANRWKKVPRLIEAPDTAAIANSLCRVQLPRHEIRHWTGVFRLVATCTPERDRIDTWDYQACHHALTHELLTVCPATNLVTNIGFGADASHTTGASLRHARASSSAVFPLKHPSSVSPNLRLSRATMRHHFGVIYWPWLIDIAFDPGRILIRKLRAVLRKKRDR